MTERLELRFVAPSAEDAQRQAREWVRAEPALRLRTIAGVRMAPVGPAYIVTVVVERLA